MDHPQLISILTSNSYSLKQPMGNTSQPSASSLKCHRPSTLSLSQIQDPFSPNLWKDSAGTYFQQHLVTLSAKHQLQSQLRIYHLRKNQNYNLVSIHSTEVTNPNLPTSGYPQLRVLTERILFSLDQTTAITTQQGLSILTQAAIGFQCLYKEVGYFQINDYLIGFNDNRQTRVWINSRWELNSKMGNNFQRPVGDVENAMVIRMIEVVEMHIEKSPFLGMFIQTRKKIRGWTFGRFIQFLGEFVVEKRFKLTKACHLNVDMMKAKTQEKCGANLLSFRAKGESVLCSNTGHRSFRNLINKYLQPHEPIHSQPHSPPPPQLHPSQKPLQFQKAPTINTMKMPECINFKSRQLSNITNQNKTASCFRGKRMSECIPLQAPRSRVVVKNRRLSSHSIESMDEKRKLVLSARETFKIRESKGEGQSQKDDSLDRLRDRLKGFLEAWGEEDMRMSCPALDPQKDQDKLFISPQGFQFKSLEVNKNAIQVNTEDEGKNPINLNLQFGQRRLKPKPPPPTTPQAKLLLTHLLPSQNFSNTRSIFINRNTNLPTDSDPPHDSIIRSTLPKYIQNSMLQKTASKQGHSSVTTLSKTKLRDSEVIHEDSQQMHISQKNLEERFLGLKLKKALTQSINIPASTTQNDNKISENDKKPLSMLDIMVIKRNLLKQKNEQELDVSVEMVDQGHSIPVRRSRD